MTDFHLQGQPHRLNQGKWIVKGEVIVRESAKISQKHVIVDYYARMVPWYFRILASIVYGLILPLLFYGFRVTPWTNLWTYWNGFLLCFGISYLVYYYRRPREGAGAVRTHLINFVISFAVLCVVGAV